MTSADSDHPDDDAGLEAAIDGRTALRRALQAWLDEAAQTRARELWWCDGDLSLWPVGERDWIETLGRWVGPGRRLIVLLADDAALQRQHPRWVAWRRTWGHLVELWVVDPEVANQLRGWALSPARCGVEILDPAIARARWVRDPVALRAALQQLQAWKERARPGLAVHPLGL
jgi:hypothetical protein